MVNTEHMQQWIDALRSGEYRKIKGKLEIGKGFNCAEGVACREALKDGVRMQVTVHGFTAFDGEASGAPRAVLAWLGFELGELGLRPDEHPMIGDRSVIYVNDHGDQTFAEIADGLYQQYLKEPEDGQH